MTAPSTLVFRPKKDRNTQEVVRDANGQIVFDVFGPAELMVAGQMATVTRKDGSTADVMIAKVSREFELPGETGIFAYGTIAEGD